MSGFSRHDMHVHTRPHSPDAHWRATLPAMLAQAAKNGVKVVGLANHLFPTTSLAMFDRLRGDAAQAAPPGLTVLVGAEVCVQDTTGRLHITADQAGRLDFVLAGPHHFTQRWVEPPPTGNAAAFVAHQQQTLLAAAQNPLVHGLAHPWAINIQHAPRRWGFAATDFLAAWTEAHFAQLGQAAARAHTALEIGMGLHFMAHHQGELFWQKYRRGLQAAREAGAKFYFGSDAHHLHVVGRLDWLYPTLKLLNFGPADIIDPLAWKISKNGGWTQAQS